MKISQFGYALVFASIILAVFIGFNGGNGLISELSQNYDNDIDMSEFTGFNNSIKDIQGNLDTAKNSINVTTGDENGESGQIKVATGIIGNGFGFVTSATSMMENLMNKIGIPTIFFTAISILLGIWVIFKAVSIFGDR